MWPAGWLNQLSVLMSVANSKVKWVTGFQALRAWMACLAGAALCILGACSLPPDRVDQFDASALRADQKVVYGRLQVFENGSVDVTDRCMVWFRSPLTNSSLVLPASGYFAQVVDVNDLRLYKLQCKLDEGLTIDGIEFMFYDQTGPHTKNYLGHITFSIDAWDPGIDYSDAVRKGVLRGLGETTAPLEIKPGIESKLDFTVDDRQADAQAVYNKQFGADYLADHKNLLYFKIDEDLH
jgi:hypothetical protein